MFFSSGQAFLGPPTPPLLLLWPCLPAAAVAHLLRRAMDIYFSSFGRKFARWLHGEEASSRKLKESAPAEFAERCFYALCHTACTAAGGYVCYSAGWLTESGDLFFAMPWPHALPHAQLQLTRAYYCVEAALAIESSFVLGYSALRLGARRQAMMIVHHSVTLMLIVASWLLGIPETGAVVMWLHSASDIFIDLLKAADAIAFHAALAPIFALALVGWVGFRFVFLPLHLLVPGWRRIRLILFGIDCTPYARCERLAINQPEFIPGTTAWLLLLVLLGLHTIWLKQLVSKALRVLFPSAPSATSVPAAATAKRATKTALAALDVPDMCTPGFVAGGGDDADEITAPSGPPPASKHRKTE